MLLTSAVTKLAKAGIPFSVHYPSRDNFGETWVITITEALTTDQLKVAIELPVATLNQQGTIQSLGKGF